MKAWTIQRSALVTGAAGCLGSLLTKRLAGGGFRVVAYVRDRRTAAHLASLPGVELVEGDVGDAERLAEAMDGCDLVFHLAARVHAPPGTPEAEFFRVNVEGTRNLMQAAIGRRPGAVIFFSTVAVYPESDEIQDEESPVNPVTPYGRSKLAAERLVLDRARAANVRATVLRLPVVYGPGDRGNVGKLIEAIRRGRYLIVGDGKNLKTMVAAGNAVDAAIAVADDERARGKIYLVADARPYTQREIAETIADLLGRPKYFYHLPYPPALALGAAADIVGRLTGRDLPVSLDRVRKLAQNTRFSADKIVRELGVVPRLSLRDGLREMIIEQPPR